MSDDDLRDRLVALNQTAAFNRWAGFELVSVSAGNVELRMRWREEAGQYAGFLHAGLIAALIDTVCGYAAVTVVGTVMAAHVSVNCMAPAHGAAFLARGQVVKSGKRQVFTRAELFSESETGARRLVASGETILVPWSPPVV